MAEETIKTIDGALRQTSLDYVRQELADHQFAKEQKIKDITNKLATFDFPQLCKAEQAIARLPVE